MLNEQNLFAPQGWQCPICKRVYSPTTPMCYYCGDERSNSTVSTNTIQNEYDELAETGESFMCEMIVPR